MELPLLPQAATVIAAPEPAIAPDISVIFTEFLAPTELVINLLGSLAYPIGIFNDPSVLLLTLVMIYLEELAERA